MTLVSPIKLNRLLCRSLYYDRCFDGVSALNDEEINKHIRIARIVVLLLFSWLIFPSFLDIVMDICNYLLLYYFKSKYSKIKSSIIQNIWAITKNNETPWNPHISHLQYFNPFLRHKFYISCQTPQLLLLTFYSIYIYLNILLFPLLNLLSGFIVEWIPQCLTHSFALLE